MDTPLEDTGHLEAELSNDVLVKMVVSHIENQSANFDTLDSKAGLILGFGLLSIAELVGFLLLAAAEAHPPRVCLSLATQILFYLGMGCLIAGSASATWALYPKPFSRGAQIITRELLEQRPRVGDVLRSVVHAGAKNAKTLDLKAKWTRIAAVLVVVGIISLAAVVLLIFASLTRVN